MYAEDIAFFVSGKCVENIQTQLNDDLDTVSQCKAQCTYIDSERNKN